MFFASIHYDLHTEYPYFPGDADKTVRALVVLLVLMLVPATS